jgi:pimeloyl-ACP methyl ester carboxylesterase
VTRACENGRDGRVSISASDRDPRRFVARDVHRCRGNPILPMSRRAPRRSFCFSRVVSRRPAPRLPAKTGSQRRAVMWSPPATRPAWAADNDDSRMTLGADVLALSAPHFLYCQPRRRQRPAWHDHVTRSDRLCATWAPKHRPAPADGAAKAANAARARPTFAGPCDFVDLDGAGHFPQLEEPANVADAILAFPGEAALVTRRAREDARTDKGWRHHG